MGYVGNSAWLVLGLSLWGVIASASLQPEDLSDFQEPVEDTGRLQRERLFEDKGPKILNDSNSKALDTAGSSSWPILIGLLLSALAVVLVIVLTVRLRLAQRFCGGYSEALLSEGDTASQFSHPGTLAAQLPGHSMREREAYADGQDDGDDDDGFIEDNYITASDKERAEREEVHAEIIDEDSDDELDIHFSID